MYVLNCICYTTFGANLIYQVIKDHKGFYDYCVRNNKFLVKLEKIKFITTFIIFVTACVSHGNHSNVISAFILIIFFLIATYNFSITFMFYALFEDKINLLSQFCLFIHKDIGQDLLNKWYEFELGEHSADIMPFLNEHNEISANIENFSSKYTKLKFMFYKDKWQKKYLLRWRYMLFTGSNYLFIFLMIIYAFSDVSGTYLILPILFPIVVNATIYITKSQTLSESKIDSYSRLMWASLSNDLVTTPEYDESIHNCYPNKVCKGYSLLFWHLY
jgi:hypothetical protein